jgi:hypothetical protein
MAIAFGVGFYASKNLSRRWKLATGLNYAYQPNTIQTGKKNDSSIIVDFGNARVAANRYYQSGNTNSYKNAFHLLQLPLVVEYNFGKKYSLYAEAGSTLSYLLSTNALVYNSATAIYVNSPSAFNKLNTSVNAGAGMHLAQHSKIPFSIGYRFGYSISTITRLGFSDQHIISHLLNVRIPLKK